MKEKNVTTYNLGTDYINVQQASIVKLKETFTIYTDKGPIELDTEICADFNKVPEEYHEIFMNVLTSKYMNKVSFGDNPFSCCKPVIKRKWYQFWKSKYFQVS